MTGPGVGRRPGWVRVLAAAHLPWLVAVLVGMPAIARADAQSAAEPLLRAAFLLKFAKFIDWPSELLPDQAPLVFCVYDAAVADALTHATAGQSVGFHPLAVSRLVPDAPLRNCGLVYVSGLDGRHVSALVTTLRGTSVLSVGDDDTFTKEGGIIQLFVEDGHMRFAVNVQAAERARLRISAQMLTLAKIVKD